jgi:hypothetical protein
MPPSDPTHPLIKIGGTGAGVSNVLQEFHKRSASASDQEGPKTVSGVVQDKPMGLWKRAVGLRIDDSNGGKPCAVAVNPAR